MFKLFEIYNEDNKRVFSTKESVCLPDKVHVNLMMSNKYKIKVDGKIATKKLINELYSNVKC
jgi:hypothetical protein